MKKQTIYPAILFMLCIMTVLLSMSATEQHSPALARETPHIQAKYGNTLPGSMDKEGQSTGREVPYTTPRIPAPGKHYQAYFIKVENGQFSLAKKQNVEGVLRVSRYKGRRPGETYVRVLDSSGKLLDEQNLPRLDPRCMVLDPSSEGGPKPISLGSPSEDVIEVRLSSDLTPSVLELYQVPLEIKDATEGHQKYKLLGVVRLE